MSSPVWELNGAGYPAPKCLSLEGTVFMLTWFTAMWDTLLNHVLRGTKGAACINSSLPAGAWNVNIQVVATIRGSMSKW